MSQGPRNPRQTPFGIRPHIVWRVEFDRRQQGFHLLDQFEEWPCVRCRASSGLGNPYHLWTIATATVVREPVRRGDPPTGSRTVRMDGRSAFIRIVSTIGLGQPRQGRCAGGPGLGQRDGGGIVFLNRPP
jgi:hypothetical protein